MLAIDIALGLAVVGLLIIGAGTVMKARARKRSSDPHAQAEVAKQRGEVNAARMDVAEAMRCIECNQPTNAEIDIFSKGAWFHQTCYRKIVS